MPEEMVPIVRVFDGRGTARWYERLGFEVIGEHRFGPEWKADPATSIEPLAISRSACASRRRSGTMGAMGVTD
ncbi:MAG: hypothetical protein U5K30_13330 [Acidimicrobiales bacterium]|nr:hypothetical protein [Acidimicrobiales bacterium]